MARETRMAARTQYARTQSPRQCRSLSPLPATTYDVVIIGGGITGAWTLWDATLRGLKALLVERNDYASGTTQATSKLIHGGLRYLKNGEIGLVRESLRERRTLARLAPHALRPEAFLFPIYRNRGIGRFKMGAALTIYDILGYDRNRGVDAEHQLPAARHLSRTETLAEESGLDFRDLKGSFVYYDYANLNPERLCVEIISAARERGARVRNYVEAGRIERQADESYAVEINDRLSGETATVRGRTVVNAGGPWADYLDRRLTGRLDYQHKTIIRSKGIHLVTRRFVHDKTVVLMKEDNTHLFVIPWRGKALIGTTDTRYDRHPDDFAVTTEDAQSVLADVNRLFPDADLALHDIEYFYGGLRPLVDDGGSSYDASRRTEIVHHDENGHAGFFTALGGKYTTSRHLAEQLLDRICEYLPGSFSACTTEHTPLPGGDFASLTELSEDLGRRYPNVAHRKLRILAGRYGNEAFRILERADSSGEVWKLDNGELYYPEEIDYLVEHHEVENIGDLLFRRSGMGTVGRLPETVERSLVQRLGRLRGWSKPEQAAVRRKLRKRYELQ